MEINDLQSIYHRLNEVIEITMQNKDWTRMDQLEDILRKLQSWESSGSNQPMPFHEELVALKVLPGDEASIPDGLTPAGDQITLSAAQEVDRETGTEAADEGPMASVTATLDEPVTGVRWSTEAADGLYKRLNARYLQAADDEAPEMDALRVVRKAIKGWIDGGREDSLPYQTELAGWNLLEDQVSPLQSVVIQPDELIQTPAIETSMGIQTLGSKEESVAQTGVVSDPVEDVVREVKVQLLPTVIAESIPVAPVQNADELSAPQVVIERETEDDRALNAPMTDEESALAAQMQISSEPDLNEVSPVQTQVEEKEITAQEPAVLEGSSGELPASEPDDALLDDFHAAQSMFVKRQVYAAFEKLTQLYSAASGSLLSVIQAERERVGARLQELTDEKVHAASEYAKKSPNDLSGQRKEWEAVREFNPQCTEAIQAIEQLDRLRNEKETLDSLDEIKRQTDAAEKKKDLEALTKVRGRLELLIDRSGDSQELRARLLNIWQYFEAAQDRVRDILGVSSTKKVEGNLREAYALAKTYSLDEGITLVPDKSGGYGPVGQLYPKAVFFESVSRDYLSQLRTKASERLVLAEQEKEQAPTRARRHLEEALALLNDPNLIEDHSRLLAPERDLLQKALDKLRETLQSFMAAEALIKKGDDAASPAERLTAYKDARRVYASYPGIDQRISSAREDIANYLATQVETAVAEAAQLAVKEEYDAAIKRLTDIRKEVSEEFPTPQDGSRLKMAFDQAQSDINKYTDSNKELHEMMLLLEQAQKALEEYRKTNDTRLVNQARTLYQQLSAKRFAHNHPKVVLFYADLTSQQDDNANWEDGQSRYYDHEWVSAYESLRKVREQSINYPQASIMAQRARAAMRADNGKEAEDRQEWKRALIEYRGAVAIFNGDPTRNIAPVTPDADCEDKYRLAAEGVTRLEPMEEHDRQKKALLDVSRTDLETARKIDLARGSLDQRVEPISQFSKISKTLKESLQQPSTLAGEMQSLLSETRIAWRETYLKVIKDVLALSVPNETLVNKACILAQELKTEGLIYEREDQLVVQRLLCLQKDQEYRKLAPQIGDEGEGRVIVSTGGIDWSAVENNRRERLVLADEIRLLTQQSGDSQERLAAVEKVKAVREELKRVARRRISQEVTRRIEGALTDNSQIARSGHVLTPAENAREAQRYLQQQLEETPWLSTDTELIGELIMLYWKAGDWEGAQQTVSHFLNNNEIPEATNYTKAWRESTQAAKAYAEGDMSRGDAYFDQLLSDPIFNLDKLVEDIQKKLRAELLTRLIQDAQDAQRRGDDESLVLAADRYAQAEMIDPGNRVVKTGLNDIGLRLAGGLANRCEQASTFRVGRRKLEDAIRQADGMLKTLQSIKSVADYLNLTDDLNAQIEQAINDLSPRLNKWLRFMSFCSNYDHALKEQLSAPETIQQDPMTGEMVGGWMMDEIDAIVDQMDREARGDNDLIAMASIRRDQAQTLRNSAESLNRLVGELMTAVKVEDFRVVIACAGQLDQLWQAERAREARWDGLSDMIHKDFSPWFTRGATDLRSHRSIAEAQQKNYDSWFTWAQEVTRLSELVENGAKKINSPLDSLKEESSMTEIIEMCRGVVKASSAFEEQIKRIPKDAPLSAKARAQKERIPEGLEEELAASKTHAEALCQEAQGNLRKAEGELVKLRRALDSVRALERRRKGGGALPQVALQPAVRQLKVCMDIDPCHIEIIQTRQYLMGLGANVML